MHLHSATTADQDAPIPGSRMIDGAEVGRGALDQLLLALLLTSIGVFTAANALLANSAVLARSLPVAAASIGVLALFCALSRCLRSPAWALVVCYGLLLLTVYGRQQWTAPMLISALLFGLGHTLYRVRPSRRDLVSALRMSAIGTATILGTPGAYTSFDMIERLHAGNVQLDTLYHASIAAMIKNYGVVSTGLNGLVETPYHALSHALFAAVSLVSRAPVIEVYGVSTWMLFAPLLIFSASASCLRLAGGRARLDPSAVWCCVCLLLVLAPFFLERWAVWDSFFVSESYLVALSLFLLALPLMLTATLGAGNLVLLGMIAALLCAAKAPVGMIFIGLFAIRLVLLNGRRKMLEAFTLAVMIMIGALLMWKSADANVAAVSFGPLQFVEQYSFLGGHLLDAHGALLGAQEAGWRTWLLAAIALGGFVGLHFVVSWSVLAIAARRLGVRRALCSPIGVMSLGAILAGLSVALLFRIVGGSAYYVSNVAFFVSLPTAAALLAALLTGPSNRLVLPAATMLVLAVNARGYWNASALSSARAQPEHSALIALLLDARTSAPRQVILEADASVLTRNPVSRCIARPFVFPAVSERPWTGVIADTDCRYEDYGYENYRPPPGSTRTSPPRWPSGSAPAVLRETLPY